MDCDVCLESFNDKDRRPKCLPCGHTFCLRCVTQQKDKKCPIDRKAYRPVASNLPDNFKIIELAQRPSSVCGWCRSCDAEASEGCLDAHPSAMCSLKRARLEDVEPRLEALARGDEALAQLGDMMNAAACDVQTQVQECFGQVERERLVLAADKGRQEAALASDPATWVMARARTRRQSEKSDTVRVKLEPTEHLEPTEQPAVQKPHLLHDHALARGAVQLLADLADPTASCVVTVVRGGALQSQVLWRGTVRPEEDAASRLLLSRMLCEETLRRELPLPSLQVKAEAFSYSAPWMAAPLPLAAWAERSNETTVTDLEMQLAMKVGSRVVRGTDWDPRWKDDGEPPGEGTIVAMDSASSGYFVIWDSSPNQRRRYFMVPRFYRLRLLPTRPQAPLPPPSADVLDLSSMSSSPKKPLPDKRLLNKRVLLGLRCDVLPNWCKALLQRMAPQLEALAMVSAQQQHLRQAAAMPGLRALHLSGRAVAVDPVVDLTGGDDVAHLAVDSLEYAVDKAPLPALLRELHIENATREQLMQVPSLASLRRLDLHCLFDAPLPLMSFEPAEPPAGLEWLRLGIYPLVTALALIRANAATLRELELVAATKEPYGCPDLPLELQRCGLSSLRRLVLWRGTVAGAFCGHDVTECLAQKAAMLSALAHAAVFCSECDKADPGLAGAMAESAIETGTKPPGPAALSLMLSTAGPSTPGPSTAGPSTPGPSTAGPSTSRSSTSGPSTSGPPQEELLLELELA
ncbi:uncharacterized protein LOC117642615 isoform X2 [Thrips palmi]|nr:uncharacterized protein LOC117642615 isoform X2 [Thrips palmi]XP_034236827.1 uncharacterized protein LOC117642615 isoform X2 [Thrips palmi]XP_034236829.1 uncharacterized protein LOC117642615 isoform X2 [Thrips palmi]XP_034236830.1 uncharacterized protein LOC117642615 isoform X2 [Thrips palmi]XP_034236831.1 uncharacterized protein LOC117642615 isoform X2 [Thrips palmi]XP_034236832.1 uncharacterized protein LOC117642615 isoform X2 [Thrips palmi]XP_034236833.1 uncharacterized protein LOC11764